MASRHRPNGHDRGFLFKVIEETEKLESKMVQTVEIMEFGRVARDVEIFSEMMEIDSVKFSPWVIPA